MKPYAFILIFCALGTLILPSCGDSSSDSKTDTEALPNNALQDNEPDLEVPLYNEESAGENFTLQGDESTTRGEDLMLEGEATPSSTPVESAKRAPEKKLKRGMASPQCTDQKCTAPSSCSSGKCGEPTTN